MLDDRASISAFLIALMVWYNAAHAGRILGSMVVAYFALGAVLAAINFLKFAIAYAIARSWIGKRAKAYVVTGILAMGFLNAWLHPFHRVRLCDDGGCPCRNRLRPIPIAPTTDRT